MCKVGYDICTYVCRWVSVWIMSKGQGRSILGDEERWEWTKEHMGCRREKELERGGYEWEVGIRDRVEVGDTHKPQVV